MRRVPTARSSASRRRPAGRTGVSGRETVCRPVSAPSDNGDRRRHRQGRRVSRSTRPASRYGTARFPAKSPGRRRSPKASSSSGRSTARSSGSPRPTAARKWVYQRTTPPLTVRRFAGGVTSRGGLFTGTAGGKLLALDLRTGALGWEASVATPKGVDRARAHRRRDQPARGRGAPGLRGRVPGPRRLLRAHPRQR